MTNRLGGLIEWDEVETMAKRTGHFSLVYDSENKEWDCSFVDAHSEKGCYYAATAEQAIVGAFNYAIQRLIEKL